MNTEHEEKYVLQTSNKGCITGETAYNDERTAIKYAYKEIKFADICGEVDNVRIVWEGESVAEWTLESTESGSSFIQIK